jgi:hypothetical protein
VRFDDRDLRVAGAVGLYRMAAGLARPTRSIVSFSRRLSGAYPDATTSERRLIERSGLFDLSYYLIQNPDVLAAGVEPVQHFCESGWREGRRPNACFDPPWYRELYLTRAPDMNPLAHYIRMGETASCRPVAYFDPAWYRDAYALPRRASALGHYLANRRSQRFAPNPHFDLAFYMARYGAEIGPNRDPFAHLVMWGAARNLDPSPVFDSRAYRAASMPAAMVKTTDLASHERQVPLVHFLDASARAAARAQA